MFSKYIASCGIAMFHWYDRVPAKHMPNFVSAGSPFDMDNPRFHQCMHWFATLTSYFFVLSGFVLTMARLTSPDPTKTKKTWVFVAERLTTTYPAYLLSLGIMVLMLSAKLYEVSASDWRSLALHVTLTQAWVPPDSTRRGVVWNGPSWFMSALFFFWLLFRPLYYWVRCLPATCLWPAFFACWFASCAAWLDDSTGRSLAHALMPRHWPRNAKTYADVYQFNPLFSLNSFVGGMVFSRIFCQAEAAEALGEKRQDWRVFASRGASVCSSIFILTLLIFHVPPCFTAQGATYQVGGLFSALHNGGLLPLHGFIIAGLCMEEEAVARLFLRPGFVWLGSISYEQYLFGSVVFNFLRSIYVAVSGGPNAAPYDSFTWQFAAPTSLTLTAILVHYYFSVPIAARLRKSLHEATPPKEPLLNKHLAESLYGATSSFAAPGQPHATDV